MSLFLEMMMLIFFGISWPTNILRSLRSGTAKGKSMLSISLCWLAYLAGITGKIVNHNITYVFVFYIINFTMITIDCFLTLRNMRRDRERSAQ